MTKNCLSLISVFLFISCVFADEKIANGVFINAEFRPRLEFDNRDFLAATGYDAYATYRTRIGLMLDSLIENTSLYIMIADSRLMGFSDPYLTGTNIGPNRWDNNLGVAEAYVEIRELFGKGTLLKIGRMSNNQGRNRIFGPGNWNVYGPRTYDGIKIGFKNTYFTAHFWSLFGLNGDRHWYFDPEQSGAYPLQSIEYKKDHTLTGLDMSLVSSKINLLMFLDLDQQPVTDVVHQTRHVAFSRITTAINYKHRQQNPGFWIDFDGAYQFGKQAYSGGAAVISSYLLAGDISYHFIENRFWFGFGFDTISGDDDASPGKVTNFYEFYYSRHSYQGHMDYFKNPAGIKTRGLQDFIFRAGMSPVMQLNFQFDLHHFRTKKPFAAVSVGRISHILGQELDVTINYVARKGIVFTAGVDVFWATREWIGANNDPSTFGYLTLSATL